jgi:hypothetical protein
MTLGELRQSGLVFDVHPKSRWRLRSLFVAFVFTLPSSFLAACQCVGGIDERFVDPSLYETAPDAASEAASDVNSEAVPEGCVFDDVGSAATRFCSSCAAAGHSSLMATSSCNCRCVARTTIPIPPRPSTRSTRNRPSITSPHATGLCASAPNANSLARVRQDF